jgi:hypothetical protein
MTATISETTACTTLAYKGLIDEQLWERLVKRLVHDEDMERTLAERVMNEALGFLGLLAHEPNIPYSPSATVDPGWHTFILYTREYAAFCDQIAGRFIHHNPTDTPGVDYSDGNTPAQTMQAMLRYGPVDEMLWVHAASCEGGGGGGGSSCHGGCDGGSGR